MKDTVDTGKRNVGFRSQELNCASHLGGGEGPFKLPTLQNPTRRHKIPTNTNTTRGLPRTRGSSGWIRPLRRVAAPRARPGPHTLAEAQLHTQATGPERDKAKTDRTDNCMHMQFRRTSAQQNAPPGPILPARRDCGRRERTPGRGTNRRPGEGGRCDRAVTCRARAYRTHSG